MKIVQQPLFPSYCFVRLEERERARVFGVQGVVRYLFWQKQAAIVREAEIDAIRLMLNEVDNELIQLKVYNPGETLHIASGSFMDVSGTVVRQQGRIVTVVLDALQLMLTVDLSKTIVKG
jgi:transcription antitermination factor NusG